MSDEKDALGGRDALSYSASHDLRAPLLSIQGFGAILLEEHAEQRNEEGRDCVQRITAARHCMSALIDGLLKLSRATLGTLEIRGVDLSALDRHLAQHLTSDPLECTIVEAVHYRRGGAPREPLGGTGYVGREGVQRGGEAILTKLRQIGVEYAQGHAAGRPVRLDELAGALGALRRFRSQ